MWSNFHLLSLQCSHEIFQWFQTIFLVGKHMMMKIFCVENSQHLHESHPYSGVKMWSLGSYRWKMFECKSLKKNSFEAACEGVSVVLFLLFRTDV
jgi:hypothetical protein